MNTATSTQANNSLNQINISGYQTDQQLQKKNPPKAKRQLNIQNIQGPSLINFTHNVIPNQVAWGKMKPRTASHN